MPKDSYLKTTDPVLRAMRDAFVMHRATARQRGVDFLFTFEEWAAWWRDTGHWHERGKRKGQYTMARFGDVGPYAPGNVYCTEAGANVKDMLERRRKAKAAKVSDPAGSEAPMV